MENVKKCKNFLATLIKLASTGKQSTEAAPIVRELVKDLLVSEVLCIYNTKVNKRGKSTNREISSLLTANN